MACESVFAPHGESAINYRIIQQEIETNKQLLDGLLQRSKENDVVLAGTPNNIYVADYAIAPDFPIGPQRLRSVIMALFLSLAGGIGLALLLEYMIVVRSGKTPVAASAARASSSRTSAPTSSA